VPINEMIIFSIRYLNDICGLIMGWEFMCTDLHSIWRLYYSGPYQIGRSRLCENVFGRWDCQNRAENRAHT